MPVDIQFSIYLASPTRWAHLTKTIRMVAVPRVGEFVKFVNEAEGDYFPFKVAEVTYRESGEVEVMTELLDNVDQRWFSFEEEQELDDFVASYLAEGWQCPRGVGPNRRAKEPGSEADT